MGKKEEEKSPERVKVLPVVEKKIVLGVLAELALDGRNFASRAAQTAIEENPDLAEVIIKGSFVLPDVQLALVAPLALYECYSRQVRQEGKLLFLVSAEVIQTRGTDRMEELMPSPSNMKEKMETFFEGIGEVDEESLRKMSQLAGEEDRKTLAEISEQSPSMATLLFAFLGKALQAQDMRGTSDSRHSLIGLFETFRVLKAQEEVNRLSQVSG